ncbi:MAG: EamA family transporter [Actinomycetes bacterium]|nr:EamA family transporter [Actinomycetes bacterium]MDX5380230.1 EamA family transporter [Actinomycetes bacterium]MDX5398926.1 EamA family transporter [Actinomycetes bacterium]MDX5449959.1 EamA family transporter [Actinomycetes bacterium]
MGGPELPVAGPGIPGRAPAQGEPVSQSRYAGAVSLFILGAVTQYVGAALAVGLFETMPAPTVAWWRIAIAAVVLLAWRRPRLPRGTWGAAALFGVVLAAMNVAFYIAIDHIPLGTAVSIEFVGPVTVAALAGSGWAQRAACAFAAGGVLTISGFGVDWGEPGTALGLAAALAAGTLWGLYVVLGKRLAGRVNGLDGLAVGMAAGAVAVAPFVATTAGAALAGPGLFALVAAVALLSSVVPYALDQVNFGVLPAATFAILLALLPATSLVVGAVMLRQVPTVGEAVGLALVSVAVVLANLPARRTLDP